MLGKPLATRHHNPSAPHGRPVVPTRWHSTSTPSARRGTASTSTSRSMNQSEGTPRSSTVWNNRVPGACRIRIHAASRTHSHSADSQTGFPWSRAGGAWNPRDRHDQRHHRPHDEPDDCKTDEQRRVADPASAHAPVPCRHALRPARNRPLDAWLNLSARRRKSRAGCQTSVSVDSGESPACSTPRRGVLYSAGGPTTKCSGGTSVVSTGLPGGLMLGKLRGRRGMQPTGGDPQDRGRRANRQTPIPVIGVVPRIPPRAGVFYSAGSPTCSSARRQRRAFRIGIWQDRCYSKPA